MNKELLKEIGCYIGSIVFVSCCAYWGGFLNFTTYQVLSDNVVNSIKTTEIEKYINPEFSPRRKKVATYKNVHPRVIPSAVLKGYEASGSWSDILGSDKKVVFYIYDENDEFHAALYSYFSRKELFGKYNFKPYRAAGFYNMHNGAAGQGKICNSISECKRVRDKAANYTLLANFLTNCGKTVCVLNPAKKQYVQLSKRNLTEAERILDILQNW